MNYWLYFSKIRIFVLQQKERIIIMLLMECLKSGLGTSRIYEKTN